MGARGCAAVMAKASWTSSTLDDYAGVRAVAHWNLDPVYVIGLIYEYDGCLREAVGIAEVKLVETLQLPLIAIVRGPCCALSPLRAHHLTDEFVDDWKKGVDIVDEELGSCRDTTDHLHQEGTTSC